MFGPHCTASFQGLTDGPSLFHCFLLGNVDGAHLKEFLHSTAGAEVPLPVLRMSLELALERRLDLQASVVCKWGCRSKANQTKHQVITKAPGFFRKSWVLPCMSEGLPISSDRLHAL